MPKPQKLEKAKLIELVNGSPGSKQFTVQFNPQTLKLNYQNQFAGGNQSQGSSPKFVGTSTTKLSMELWFDSTLQVSGTPPSNGDVRKLTEQVAYFMQVQTSQGSSQDTRTPPSVRFQWGSFVFSGTMESMDETIDLFSPDGVPLRASVSINLTKHDLQFEFPTHAVGNSTAAGVTPLTAAKAGDSVAQMAAQAGITDWQGVARANGITNPRNLQPGALIDLSISA